MLGLWFLGLGRVVSESIAPRLIFRRLLLKNRMAGLGWDYFVRHVHQPAWRCFSLCRYFLWILSETQGFSFLFSLLAIMHWMKYFTFLDTQGQDPGTPVILLKMLFPLLLKCCWVLHYLIRCSLDLIGMPWAMRSFWLHAW